jgi:hypothetical protein
VIAVVAVGAAGGFSPGGGDEKTTNATQATTTGSHLPPTGPLVETGAATGVERTAATLTGTVRWGRGVSAAGFVVGRKDGQGNTTLVRRGGGNVVVATVRHLMPGTRYHYRLAARAGSRTSVGRERVFTTRR